MTHEAGPNNSHLTITQEFSNEGTPYEYATTEILSSRSSVEMDVLTPKGEPSYYSMRWPAIMDYKRVAEVIREAGALFGAEEYICHEVGSSVQVSYCGEPTPEEQVLIDEQLGKSPQLDKILKEEFNLLRVDTDSFALVWEYHPDIEGTPRFGLISESPSLLTDEWLMKTMKSTITEETPEPVEQITAELKEQFTRYAS